MCRIAGFIDFNRNVNYDAAGVIVKMRDTMIHGGPDDAGVYLHSGGASSVAFGHRRLSIIELSDLGHQPMKFNNLTIIFNGEIYNYAEIREELLKQGYSFTSGSDTEVILKAFHKWGYSCVDKFIGMWAFAIYDENEEKLVLCRDRVGVKPLYWYLKDGLFMFSSELKAFHMHPRFDKKLDMSSLGMFFQYGYIPSPRCIFDNANKLEPAHFLTIDKKRAIHLLRYWDAAANFQAFSAVPKTGAERFEEEAALELEEILAKSFKARMVSDVAVGMFLSGGVDSTLLLAILNKKCGFSPATFTIGFNEKEYDEAPYAKKIAQYFNADHRELYCSSLDAFEVIEKLPSIYDEPLGDSSAIPTYLVSKLAKSGVKVSLSADGGDEQFYGYDLYYILENKVNKIKKSVFAPIITGAMEFIDPDIAFSVFSRLGGIMPGWKNFRDKYIKLRNTLKINDPLARFDFASKYFIDEDLSGLGIDKMIERSSLYPHNEYAGLDNFSRMSLLDLKTYLPDDVLVKVDRAAMSVALEGRDPFLDHRIIEFAAKLPPGLKYKNGVRKYLLKKILYKYVPRELVDRPKKGFAVPVYEWFKNDLKNLYMQHLAPEKIKREGVLDSGFVGRLLSDYFAGRGVNAHKLWFIFVFELWHEKYMSGAAGAC